MNIVETDRLVLRRLGTGDAAFILRLLNDPSWLRYIGDRGVGTLDDAESYLRNGPLTMYARLGFGLYLVETKVNALPIGICGFVKRETLDDVDLRFAFLPALRGGRYAFESASATMAYGRRVLGLSRVVAITAPDNAPSIRLVERLGFGFERLVRLGKGDEDLRLYDAAA